MHPRTKDLTGKRFGKLVVREFAGYTAKAQAATWLCDCDCGKHKVILAGNLIQKLTMSCGCLCKSRVTNGANRLPPGRSGRNALLGSYKYEARKRGLEWNLSDEDFDKLTKDNCYYCGKEPAQTRKTGHKNETGHGWYTYNGIDRVNNTEGYTKSNCVSCCKVCNSLKRDVTIDIACKMADFVTG